MPQVGPVRAAPLPAWTTGQDRRARSPGDVPGRRGPLVALDEWVSAGRTPPASRVPRRSDGTLVPPLPQSGAGFPSIPGVLDTGREVLDFGPLIGQGILTTLPPALVPGQVYRSLVPRTDADGNDVAGLRLPEIAVPLATYIGWATRRAGFAERDECNQFGQYVPFRQTRAERIAAGDPRPSIEERTGPTAST